MSDELQKRLRRLGVAKGARNLVVPPVRPRMIRDGASGDAPGDTPGHAALPPGRIAETAVGPCYIVDRVYAPDYQHGPYPLQALIESPTATLAAYTDDDRLAAADWTDLLFLDTETTGLAGAGTMAFMVGLGFFERRPGSDDLAFVVRQYFLRDYGEEPAMLQLLSELAQSKKGLVSFNGRSFDLRLLDARFAMNRSVNILADLPHLDLLPLARRVWRRRHVSCALGHLEEAQLGIRRSQEDVPGRFIPEMYYRYLQTGETAEIGRIFYHNRLDVLSMATLAVELTRLLERPLEGAPEDQLSVAAWQIQRGLPEAETTLAQLMDRDDLPVEIWRMAMSLQAGRLKRNNERAKAVPLWQQLAVTSFDDIEAHVELAKYFEWEARQLAEAQRWTAAALTLMATWSRARERVMRPALRHRLARLDRKLAASNDEDA